MSSGKVLPPVGAAGAPGPWPGSRVWATSAGGRSGRDPGHQVKDVGQQDAAFHAASSTRDGTGVTYASRFSDGMRKGRGSTAVAQRRRTAELGAGRSASTADRERARVGCGHMLTVASGALSVAFGCYLSYHIGIVDGLLTAHPHWTPR